MTGRRWIVIGSILGVAFTASPGSMFVLLLVGLAALRFARAVREPSRRRFVLLLFLIGFLARAGISLGLDGLSCILEREIPAQKGQPYGDILNVVDHTRRFMQMGDSDYYSERGYALVQRARGNLPLLPRYYREKYGENAYLHVIAVFYALFDFSPIAVKLLNCFFGALFGPLLFLLFLRCFNEPICRWASALISFFPSMLLWSVGNLKEPFLFLLTCGLYFLFLRIFETPRWSRWGWLLLFLGLLAVHAQMRSVIYSGSLFASLLLAIFLSSRIHRFWKIAGLALSLAGAFLIRARLLSGIAQAFAIHIGYVTTPGTVYRYLPDPFYGSREYLVNWSGTAHWSGEILGWLGRATAHYLLEPLPSRIDGLFLSMTYPQMVIWYFLLPFAFMGAWIGIRKRIGGLWLFLLPTLSWILVGALTSGNIGTVFRVRDMVTPYMLLFACAGVWAFLHGTGGIEPDAGN